MKYCIQTIHRKNGNRYLFAGFKRDGDQLIPINHFFSRSRIADVMLFPSIRAACLYVRNINDAVWRSVICPYPISIIRWLNVSSFSREVTPDA